MNSQKGTVYIPALDCPDETAIIEKSLQRLPGVVSLTPDYVGRTLEIEFIPQHVDLQRIALEIRATGFDAEPLVAPRPIEIQALPPRWRPTTTAGAALLAAALTLHVTGWASAAAVSGLAIASALASSLPVARAAARALRARLLDMNVLMTVAAAGAIGIGDYFEAATAMFLFGVALWMESFSMDRARRTVWSLVEMAPKTAHLVRGHEIVDVEVARVAVGDRLLVRPGERVPVDGTICEGSSSVNQAPITGESMPVEKEPGDSVFAGSLNGEGSIQIEARRTADSSTLAHIARLVAQTQAARSPTQRFVDAFAHRYTPIVIALAVLVAFGPPLLASMGLSRGVATPWTEWLHRGLVLLVIACPCALVISTPVTIVCGLFHAARRGVLVKGGVHLENAGRIEALAIDKTGTLTTAAARVTGVEPAAGHTADEVLAAAAALENHSEHPLARAIAMAAAQRGLPIAEVAEFAAIRGFGVRGNLDGNVLFVGSPRMFHDQGLLVSPLSAGLSAETLALVGGKSGLWGVIRMADLPRPEAAGAIEGLKRIGIRRIAMLSGDSRAVASRLATELGIDEVHAELLPEDKVKVVQELTGRFTHLAMVGDGVNDAPALAAASLGIALGSQSSDTALETADIVVMTPDLRRLVELVLLGRRVRRVLGQNIVLALATKGLVLLLAAAGLATMWMAVAADVGASLLVTLNGMRLAGGRLAS